MLDPGLKLVFFSLKQENICCSYPTVLLLFYSSMILLQDILCIITFSSDMKFLKDDLLGRHTFTFNMSKNHISR